MDLSALVSEVRGRLTPDECARLQVRLPAAQTPVCLPRGALGQAVWSLVKNAFDATDGQAGLVVLDVAQDAGRLRVTVRDEGTGLSVEALTRAGEPFFTTKEPGRGLGLGLFLARVFAERVGGGLSLECGHGTTARLDVPNRASPAVPPGSSDQSS